MAKILAALDNSPAARSVLTAAVAIGPLFNADVEAVHVKVDDERTLRSAAKTARVQLRTMRGGTVGTLAYAAQPPDVSALVLGARGTHIGRHPAGNTALKVITSLRKPVVVVPPDLSKTYRLERILVPLNGTMETASALAEILELARSSDLDVVVLHVYEEATIPSVTDQPHHETDAWVKEFIARYCGEHGARVRVELRIGLPGEHVLDVADDVAADLIALGWAQDLASGHAAVVRRVLSGTKVPVLLVPVPERIVEQLGA